MRDERRTEAAEGGAEGGAAGPGGRSRGRRAAMGGGGADAAPRGDPAAGGVSSNSIGVTDEDAEGVHSSFPGSIPGGAEEEVARVGARRRWETLGEGSDEGGRV
jgi:hypothetical protein